MRWPTTTALAVTCLVAGGMLFSFVTAWEQSFLAGLFLIVAGLVLLVRLVVQLPREVGHRNAARTATAIGGVLVAALSVIAWGGLRPGAGDLDILPALILGVPVLAAAVAAFWWAARLRSEKHATQ